MSLLDEGGGSCLSSLDSRSLSLPLACLVSHPCCLHLCLEDRRGWKSKQASKHGKGVAAAAAVASKEKKKEEEEEI